jgi:Immunoglobulin domain
MLGKITRAVEKLLHAGLSLIVIRYSRNAFASLPGNVYIMAPPRNTTAVEGSRVRLGCHADGYPDNITYRWYRNGIDVQLVSGLMKVRGQIQSDGSLNIERVVKDDTGWYKCRPSNGVGAPAPEAEAYLNVTC